MLFKKLFLGNNVVTYHMSYIHLGFIKNLYICQPTLKQHLGHVLVSDGCCFFSYMKEHNKDIPNVQLELENLIKELQVGIIFSEITPFYVL